MDSIKYFIIAVILIFGTIAPAGASRGEQPKITEVTLEGNRLYSDRRLRRKMVTRPSSLFKKRRFHRRVLDEDLAKIRSFYHNNGYLDAFIIDEVSVNEEDNTVRINITLHEGERFTLSSVETLGNYFYSDSHILQRTGIKEENYFTKAALDRAASRILSLYTDNGFSEVQLNTDINIDYIHSTVSVDFFISEGGRYRISEIIIEGNEKTKDTVIMRALAFKETQYVNFSRLFRSRRNLLGTALFSSVFINHSPPQKQGEEKKDIVIQVEERDSVELAASAGYDTREHFWQQAEISNRNLYGTSRKAGLVLRRSGIERSAEGSFNSPWNLGYPVNVDLNIFAAWRDESGYEVTETGGGVAMSRMFGNILRLSLSYDHKISRYRELKEERFDKRRVYKNIITLQGTYDTRDSIFYPARGSLLSLKNEILTGEYPFLRTSADTRFFYTATPETVIGTALRASVIFTHLAAEDLPPDERLYSGGPFTIRGFKYRHLGPADESPSGGKAKLILNILEVRLNIYRALGISAFTDAGQVWENLDIIKPFDLRASAGGGLFLTLPFGVFRLEYAFNLDQLPGEDPGVLYFGSGLAF